MYSLQDLANLRIFLFICLALFLIIRGFGVFWSEFLKFFDFTVKYTLLYFQFISLLIMCYRIIILRLLEI